ncbi:MAG TPA: hypothetical protein DC054_19825 [Blastocatellia bacterium]|nr:hypothetical protein [Blastocatellia bacterium]
MRIDDLILGSCVPRFQITLPAVFSYSILAVADREEHWSTNSHETNTNKHVSDISCGFVDSFCLAKRDKIAPFKPPFFAGSGPAMYHATLRQTAG